MGDRQHISQTHQGVIWRDNLGEEWGSRERVNPDTCKKRHQYFPLIKCKLCCWTLWGSERYSCCNASFAPNSGPSTSVTWDRVLPLPHPWMLESIGGLGLHLWSPGGDQVYLEFKGTSMLALLDLMHLGWSAPHTPSLECYCPQQSGTDARGRSEETNVEELELLWSISPPLALSLLLLSPLPFKSKLQKS